MTRLTPIVGWDREAIRFVSVIVIMLFQSGTTTHGALVPIITVLTHLGF